MNLQSNKYSYSALLRFLHWGMLLLIVAVFASIEMRVFYDKGTDMRNAFKSWHFMLGLTVLLLVVMRIISRLRQPYPLVEPVLPQWQAVLSKLTHIFLYALMIIMPITGWLTLSAEGKPIPFGLPSLITVNEGVAHDIEEFHELFGKVGYALIAVHVIAAAYHQWLRKDNVFKRMWH